jgi:prepilin-type N-terminal cleavage/methylation domain-containing protein
MRKSRAFTLVELPVVSKRKAAARLSSPKSGFTLVELLVVIGIIAVLIAILLPALAAARRQAATVKCAAALREIGACFKMYEIDSKGYYPVARLNGWKPPGAATGTLYSVDGLDYPLNGIVGSTVGSAQAHWYVFLAKYATKTKVGNAANTDTAVNASDARKSIFYGCPAFGGFNNGVVVGDVNMSQSGYGMNPYASWDVKYPVGASFPPANPADNWKEYAVHDISAALSGSATYGSFLKAKTWVHPDRKLLIADSSYWVATSNAVPTQATYPPAIWPQHFKDNLTVPVVGQTYLDIYRHGKDPPRDAAGNYDAYGGKISYNILYADLHVATQNNGKEAYLSTRMRFPL